ncbi:hypothetical protein D869_gp241 [Caulobacter phage CcrRogue]|uniref:Uncharacterized protein n=1 Tax=Caulobacter phage CcrRogue TaxID=2927986 RepID=K4JSF1_9CAUD|nr:hypothetical protein D869_gp241 [Caulobacter phage CcrRogue]AFU86673.1 hypothetical protein CcrRogue_gp191 [Caulobacter phage CcrRogue]
METSDKFTLKVTPTYTRKSAMLHLASVSLIAVSFAGAELIERADAHQFGGAFFVALAAVVASAWATFWGVTEVRGLRDSTDADTRSFDNPADAVAFMKERLGLTDAELRAELEKQLAKVSA